MQSENPQETKYAKSKKRYFIDVNMRSATTNLCT